MKFLQKIFVWIFERIIVRIIVVFSVGLGVVIIKTLLTESGLGKGRVTTLVAILILGGIMIAVAYLSDYWPRIKSFVSQQKKCPYCAETIKAEAIACKHCGNDLQKLDQNSLDKYVQRPSELPIGNCPLFFKNGQAALEYSCKYMDCSLRVGSILPALVLDSPVVGSDNGVQRCTLRVASADGGFQVSALALSAKGPKLEPGMLVAWEYSADLTEVMPALPLFGRIGFIVASLHPELDIEKGWKIHDLFERERK